LREIGINPDMLLCRTEEPLSQDARRKIALFCNVPEEAVIDAIDVESIYEVPIKLQEQGLDRMLMKRLNLRGKRQDLDTWKKNLRKLKNARRSAAIAVVGKYTRLFDSYKSINEALVHAGIVSDSRVEISWVDAGEIEKNGPGRFLRKVAGILIPGGFGSRGIEGKIIAAGFARKKKIPFLGICVGMQCAAVEFAREKCKLGGANSFEFDPSTPHAVIDLMPEQKKVKKKGGTMRLGSYPAELKSGTFAHRAYKVRKIRERHRHRYEFNMSYREQFEKAGMVLSGLSPDGRLVEIIELPEHPWFVACQFHPEFKSRFGAPHPLFRDFVRAALK
jgi:CTP synthase